jgi:lipid-binding SYLF domain-containing protein
MSKAQLLFASVLGGAALALSPLVAPAQDANQNAGQSAGANASGPQKLVDQSTQVVKRMQQDPDLGALMARAQGVLIIPSYGKGAFVVGAKSGEGVLLVHENGGRWSNPAFYNLAGGARIGGELGPIAYILMSPHAVSSLAGAKSVALNANSGFTIATWSKKAKAQGDLGAADMVLWSGAAKGTKPKPGAAAGGNNLSQDFAANEQYYRARNLDAVAVLQGRVSNPGAAPLQESLSAFG